MTKDRQNDKGRKMTKDKMEYLPIIGIEVHVELKTKSKMFCGCSANHFGVAPNTHTCPVCLGLAGALPVPNKKAIDWCILIGLALNCEINNESKFDRKNYFYPDLPKGYQISQYDQPFCQKGRLVIARSEATKQSLKIATTRNDGSRNDIKTIGITRVHMEEDTGKLVHDKTEASLIDFNRSGVPLVEIVTEPDINSVEEAITYLKKIQQIVRYLDVSDCDMEKGSMRCEVNISLAACGKRLNRPNREKCFLNLPKYKVEVKNINSFKFVKKAIEYEIRRQTEILEAGKIPVQETRGFSEKTGRTFSQRTKEAAHDYRYFPEPDIPPFTNLKSKILDLKSQLPELPDRKMERFIKEYSLSEDNALRITTTLAMANYFEAAVNKNKSLAKQIANLIINQKVDVNKVKPEEIAKMINQQKSNIISDQNYLIKIIDVILKNNSNATADYKKGKQEAVGFLIGQVMRETKGKADAQIVRKILIEKLNY